MRLPFLDAELGNFVSISGFKYAACLVFKDLRNNAFLGCHVSEHANDASHFNVLGAAVGAGVACSAKPESVAL